MTFEKEVFKRPPLFDLEVEKKGPEGATDFVKFIRELEHRYPEIVWLPQKVKDGLRESSSGTFTLLVKDAGETVAALIAEDYGESDNFLYGRFMIVDPKHQGKGVGTSLLDYLKSRYQNITIEATSLGIGIDQNDLYKFYRKNGFSRTDEESHHMVWIKEES